MQSNAEEKSDSKKVDAFTMIINVAMLICFVVKLIV